MAIRSPVRDGKWDPLCLRSAVQAPGKADRRNPPAQRAHSSRIRAKVSKFPHPTTEVGEPADSL